MKHILVIACLLGIGCSPTLHEGRFNCSDNACPPGWSCRLSDHRCYSGAQPDAGQSDAAAEDAFAPRGFFEPCQRNSDCASGECNFGDLETNSIGYCTQTCANDTECVSLGPSIECTTSSMHPVCTVTCGVDAPPCPMGSTCAFLDRLDTGEFGDCLAPGALPQPLDVMGCGMDRDCFVGICARIGSAEPACARPCGGEGACAPGESCVMSSRGQVCAR